MPFTILTAGGFTSAGVGVKIPMPSSPDYVVTTNVTAIPTTTNFLCLRGEWFGAAFGSGASPAAGGIRWRHSNGSTASVFMDSFTDMDNSILYSGFTYVTTVPQIEAQAPNAITGITAASPAVVTQVNSYSEGDIIQFYGTTGMLQIAGMNFQISSVSGTGYTLTGLRAAGFAAAATAGFTRRISKMLAVDPQFLYITEITQATQAVVRTSVDPTAYYVVGMKVHFSIPYSFGMTQMDQLTGTIVAMSSTNYTMTVDIDSSAFTAFAFPASSSSPSVPLFATLAPAGASTRFDPVTNIQTGYDFQFQPFRTGQFTPYMYLGAGIGAPAGQSGDNINWIAYKMEN
jgi:hypothetical protein